MDSGAIQMPPAPGPEPASWLDLVALPWRRYLIISRFAPAQVVAAMREATEPRRRHRLSAGAVDGFEGTVAADNFLVNRIIGYRDSRNAFLPFVTGQIEPVHGGTRILITMRPHLVVLAFLIVWMLIPMGLMLAPGLFYQGPLQLRTFRLLGLGFFAFSYLLCSIPFGLEARWALKMLHKILLPRRWNQWGRKQRD